MKIVNLVLLVIAAIIFIYLLFLGKWSLVVFPLGAGLMNLFFILKSKQS